MQTILVVNTLQDRWPLGDIAFGAFFLIIGQVILYVFSNTICNAVQHYLDGLFFATICNLLAVMMVYKVCAHFPSFHMTYANIKTSTGIPSPAKISNSPLGQSRTTGKSKSCCQRTSAETHCTKTRNTRIRITQVRPRTTLLRQQGETQITGALHTRL